MAAIVLYVKILMLLQVLSGVRFVMMSDRSDGGVTLRFQDMEPHKLLCGLSDRFVMMLVEGV